MCTTTLPSIFELFPDDIKPYVRKTHIKCYGGSEDVGASFEADMELFLPSEYEMFNSTQYANQEGQYLKYWRTHNTAEDRKKTQLGQTSLQWYWLRSAFRSGSYSFAIVGSTGSLSNFSANDTGGVCVCLSI